MKERLQKVLANAGVASRRRCEALIRDGHVRVNGSVVREMGLRVDASYDDIEVDGHRIAAAAHPTYILVHKPRGVVSTARDESGRPAIVDMVGSKERVFPVGRLDIDSEGLILLTNDGALAHLLSHPRFEHEKEYHVLVRGRPTEESLRLLAEGVVLEDGIARSDRVGVLLAEHENTWLDIVLHEGRKRQIRRMCAAIGLPVVRLIRVRIGPFCLGELAVGESRPLNSQEMAAMEKIIESGG